ncbi:MAG: hypothetical protein IJ592_02065 [Candidatus Methanomethylophilaceae archaeon]|nr:hypothetical protein [Candidatus Methanomethylophilaceae archaeon]
MTSTKYEREIRFFGKQAEHLEKEKREILAKGELTDADKKRIEEIDATIQQYNDSRKEIEDSYIEAGLELPLASRNLNASVYPIGASFEPVGRDYRKLVIDETNARNAIAAKAYEGYEVSDSEDIDELNDEVQAMTEQLTNLEQRIVKADMDDDVGEKLRLTEEANKLRSKRENTINKIKVLKSEGARSAKASGVSVEFQEKVNRNEEQIAALKTQLAMVRSDVYEVKDMLAEIAARLGISRHDRDDPDE